MRTYVTLQQLLIRQDHTSGANDMGILARIIGRGTSNPLSSPPTSGDSAHEQAASEHLLKLHIPFDANADGLPLEPKTIARMHKLQRRLERVIEAANAGEVDGNEFGDGECTFFIYGPSADRLWEVAEPVLRKASVPAGAYAIKRYGEPGADTPSERLEL